MALECGPLIVNAFSPRWPGPQIAFLQSPADICIYGGAAGGGKTVGLILEPLRHATPVANFSAVFFRRKTPQITNPGGLWDESQKFYPPVFLPSTPSCAEPDRGRYRHSRGFAGRMPPHLRHTC